MEDKEKEIDNEYRKRFIRWQQLTQTQLSNTNNLILTFALGFLGFALSKTGLRIPTCCCLFFPTVFGYLLLLISLLTGLLLTINRLYDFRNTKDIVKLKRDRFKNKNDETLDAKIVLLTSETDKLGKTTWCLLHWQLWTFFSGLIFLLITIIIQNN